MVVGIVLSVLISATCAVIYYTFRNVRPIEHFREHADHLIVIMHGFHSTPAESRWITSQLLKVIEAEHKPISILRTAPVRSSTRYWWDNYACTNDGLSVIADRCLDQIYNFVVKHRGSIKKISYIGQSLGGLYGREVVRKSQTIPGLKELNPGAFVTLASPNLGCRPLLSTWYGSLVRLLSKKVWGLTGLEIMEEDENRFLERNAHEQFQAVNPFRKLCLIAKSGDLHVPVSSALLYNNNWNLDVSSWTTRLLDGGLWFLAHSSVAAALPFTLVGDTVQKILSNFVF